MFERGVSLMDVGPQGEREASQGEEDAQPVQAAVPIAEDND